MPSSIRTRDTPKAIIPPTPESDTTTSPWSPHTISDKEPPIKNGSPEPQPVVPQKRKAGRKPLYKTAQERRDRNRRAQLAFRARRSDYLARLEETCRSLQEVVVELQESNRMANDDLARERNKVKHLERLFRSLSAPNVASQSISGGSTIYPSSSAISIPTSDNTCSGAQGVSSQLFPQEFSLITLEQQFSPSNSTILSPPALNAALINQNYLGMLPLPYS